MISINKLNHKIKKLVFSIVVNSRNVIFYVENGKVYKWDENDGKEKIHNMHEFITFLHIDKNDILYVFGYERGVIFMDSITLEIKGKITYNNTVIPFRKYKTDICYTGNYDFQWKFPDKIDDSNLYLCNRECIRIMPCIAMNETTGNIFYKHRHLQEISKFNLQARSLTHVCPWYDSIDEHSSNLIIDKNEHYLYTTRKNQLFKININTGQITTTTLHSMVSHSKKYDHYDRIYYQYHIISFDSDENIIFYNSSGGRLYRIVIKDSYFRLKESLKSLQQHYLVKANIVASIGHKNFLLHKEILSIRVPFSTQKEKRLLFKNK